MKVFLPIVALAGLGSAADMNVWDLDDSCQTPERKGAFDKAYSDAEVLAVKAQEDLEKLKGARPDFVSNMRTNWDRIARAATNMFGFVPNKDGHDPSEEHYSNVRYVYDRMVKTLNNDEMIPANGYGGLKPLLLCDESKFVWVGRDDKDPHDPAGRPLRESRPKEMGDSKAGAWVYKKRYLVNGVKQANTGLCRPGVFAVTLTRNDFIIFCPPSFQDPVAGTRSAVDAKDSVQKDDMLDTYSATSLSRVMVHELAHWFGGDGNGGTENRNIPDQQAVGKEGALVWQKPDGKRTTDASLKDLKRYLTYNFMWVSNLARSHEGANAGNSGPSKATFTAESYALFALMSYMDNWDWANDGKAKAFVDEMIPYERLPNSKKVRLG
ncbi:hypothetical protein FMEXI_11623 [Fusarium mexicanum]|uniref:Lysine-specific metallo-endopeptidase domain-containing protein n=1 Tax=Fusarium mexicanum TaxID=751941 RepID=A0A8H5MLR8_9HYPO|nr:hypothetical protein FMEXI_11623 [Fusarium mexicanum]